MFFQQITPRKFITNTIASHPITIGEGSGQATVVFDKFTVHIQEAIYDPNASTSILSVLDLNRNDLIVISSVKSSSNNFYTVIKHRTKPELTCKFPNRPNGICHIVGHPAAHITTYATNCKSETWHARLGHPGIATQRRLATSVTGLPSDFLSSMSKSLPCVPCSQGKYSVQPSIPKSSIVQPFLSLLHSDICGPISPQCGPFRYFMVVIDSTSRYFHVILLTSRNEVFPKLLILLTKLRNQFPDFNIKTIRFDNAAEFTSSLLLDYLQSLGISIETSVAHAHMQNGMAESLIKRLQIVIRTLLLGSNLPLSAWGHAAMHAAQLLRLRPLASHTHSPHQLATGETPSVSHLRVFGCLVYVPIAPTQRSKIGPQRREAIYVGFDSPSIIRYLDSQSGELFRARFVDCLFHETVFPALGGDLGSQRRNDSLIWNASEPDPYNNSGELEVRRLLDLQRTATAAPDAFANLQRVTVPGTKPLTNLPIRLDIDTNGSAKDTAPQRKRGRPIGSKDKTQRVRRARLPDEVDESIQTPMEETNEVATDQGEKAPPENVVEVPPDTEAPPDDQVEVMSFHVAHKLLMDDPDPKTYQDAQRSSDWPKWQEAISSELQSLKERNVFGPVQECPHGVSTVGSRWVFTRKRDASGNVIRYKARLVAQGFSQKPGIDYFETYAPVMDSASFRFLISFSVRHSLQMHLMDVVTAYLYGPIDTDIYMNQPDGLPVSDRSTFRKPIVKLHRALYGLKQAGRLWYHYLSGYLTERGFVNSDLCPCVFVKHEQHHFVILAIYVDDINIIGTENGIADASRVLTEKFQMKHLGKTSLCLGLKMEHLESGIFVHQTHYVRKMLKRFSMEHANPCRTPLPVRTLDPPHKDEFGPLRLCDRQQSVATCGPEWTAGGGAVSISSEEAPGDSGHKREDDNAVSISSVEASDERTDDNAVSISSEKASGDFGHEKVRTSLASAPDDINPRDGSADHENVSTSLVCVPLVCVPRDPDGARGTSLVNESDGGCASTLE